MIEWLVNEKIFRNANHAIWFLTSIGFLLLTVVLHLFPNQRLIFVVIPAIINLPPFITSFIAVHIQKRESEIYSQDCIWFNLILILVYILLFFFFR